MFQLSRFDPDHYLLVESHVRSRVSAVPLVLFRFSFTGDFLMCLPGSGGEGKRFFCFFSPLETDEWPDEGGGREGGIKQREGRTMTEG